MFKQYGNESIAVVTANPYRLADEIWGIGFKTADTIAKKLGFGHERFERLRSGIFYTLNKLSELGHCFAYKNELLQAGSELLEVSA
ncbi:MAG: ATP-dependent RecD-like DNA helicase, partial [Synergistaceae bacterium]|nr:ATP-dependent RecD-like DNA helicase [Synergistaceae bacterium]